MFIAKKKVFEANTLREANDHAKPNTFERQAFCLLGAGCCVYLLSSKQNERMNMTFFSFNTLRSSVCTSRQVAEAVELIGPV